MSAGVSKKLKPQEVRSFQSVIWKYYKKHGRKLPWRPPALKIRKNKTIDSYKVLVSEMMLQQTQVARVLKKYPLFIKRFPNIQALAKASLYEVLSLWSGLGYNRRAKFLYQTAKIIVEKYRGIVPSDAEILLGLPGIGVGTVGAISAFAFNKSAVFIETNIRTVFIHFFFQKKHKKIHDTQILSLIEQTIDTKNPREWYYALMDYGVYLKSTYTNPSRMSAHHTKQSAFQGSRRQVRGEILKLLLEHESLSIQAIKKEIRGDKKYINEVFKDLQKENFVHVRNRFVTRTE